MKERTYGWYPPVKDIYTTNRSIYTPYQEECLYKFKDTMYHTKLIKPPSPSLVVRGVGALSQTPTPSSCPTKDELSVRKNRLKYTKDGSIPKFRKIPTPLECWQSNVSETAYSPQSPTYNPLEVQSLSGTSLRISWPKTANRYTLRECTKPSPPEQSNCTAHQEENPRQTLSSLSNKSKVDRAKSATVHRDREVDRAKSATVHRDREVDRAKSATVHRDREVDRAKSATMHRDREVDRAKSATVHRDREVDRAKSATVHRDRVQHPPRNTRSAGPSRFHHAGSRMAMSRSETPTQAGYLDAPEYDDCVDVYTRPTTPYEGEQECVKKEEVTHSPDNKQDFGDDELDYEGVRDKYGWLAEVHGDPLGLKKIMKRLPYVVVLDKPTIEPEPPNVHLENKSTFFLNTIPRKPARYTVAREWLSEVLQSKRMALQNKMGTKYRWKNFSFVY